MPSTTEEIKLLKTSRRIERSVDRRNNMTLQKSLLYSGSLVQRTGYSELANKHVTARKQSGTDKASLRNYELRLDNPPEIMLDPPLRLQSELSNDDDENDQIGESIRIEENQLEKKMMVKQDETQLPQLPMREKHIQKAKNKYATSTLESPNQAQLDMLVKRYGIKSQNDEFASFIEAVVNSPGTQKKQPSAVQFLDIAIQNTNNSKQQKKMKGANYISVTGAEKKKPSKAGVNITPDLTTKLNKYDSEEQLLMKNAFNIKHDIRGHASGLGYLTKGIAPSSKLENFQHAAKIYNRDVPSKRASISKNRGSNALNISKGCGGSSMSLHSSTGEVLGKSKKSCQLVPEPDSLLGQDWHRNVDNVEEQRYESNLQVVDQQQAQHINNNQILYTPVIDTLPSLQQEQQFKVSANSFTKPHQQQHPTGIVIPRKFKQLVPPTYNSLANSQAGEKSNLRSNVGTHKATTSNMFLKKQNQQKQLNTKKAPINIYLSQPSTLKEPLSPSPNSPALSKKSKVEQKKERVNMAKRLEQQKMIQSAFPSSKQSNQHSKNLRPEQLSSKKPKTKAFSRTNSSKGINTLPTNTITKVGANPIAVHLEMADPKLINPATRTVKEVRLPTLPVGTASSQIDQVSIGAVKRKMSINKPQLQASRQVSQHSDGRLGSKEELKRRSLSKESGDLYAQIVQRKSTNKFNSTFHSKGCTESRMIIQQPVLDPQRHQKFLHHRDSLQQDRLSKQSMTMFEAASEQIKTPIVGRRSRKSTAQHKEEDAQKITKSLLREKNFSTVAPKVKSRKQSQQRKGLKRIYDEQTSTQIVQGIGVIQLQTPFETPESSQVTLPLDRGSIPGQITNTELRKKHRNNLNPAVTESLKSLLTNTHDQLPLRMLNSSGERVLLYSERMMDGEHMDIAEGENEAHYLSKAGLPALLLTEQDEPGASVDSFRERKSVEGLNINLNSKLGKQKETYKNAIAIYSQTLVTPLKGHGRNLNIEFLNSAHGTASKESIAKNSSPIVTSKLQKSQQIVQKMITTTKEKQEQDLMHDLLIKAYQGRGKKRDKRDSNIPTLVTKPETYKVGKLKPVREERSLSPRLHPPFIKKSQAKVVKILSEQHHVEPQLHVEVKTEQTPKVNVRIPNIAKQFETLERPVLDRSVNSKATKARLFDQQRKKLTETETCAVNKTPIKATKQSEQLSQEAKAKGLLLKMMDSSASLNENQEQRNQTPPQQHRSNIKQTRSSSLITKKSITHFQSQGIAMQKQFSLDDFQWLSILGRGNFGQVSLVKHTRTGIFYAMKQIQKERIQGDKHIQHVKNEKQILKDLTDQIGVSRHEASFFVNFVETLQDEENLYLLLEYLPGGELLQQIRLNLSLTMEQALFYLAEVLVAIQQLHQKNIIYRDLKPENILLDREGHIKLIDFGFSKRLNDLKNDRVRTNCGTPAYAAPEVLVGAGYNYKTDIWSFGILICEMLGGFTPFGPEAMEIGVAQDGFFEGSPAQGYSSMPPHKIIEHVQTGRIILPKNLTPVTRDLVRKILVADPNVRPEIRDIMQHKFFEGIDWHNVARKLPDPPHIPDSNLTDVPQPRAHTTIEEKNAKTYSSMTMPKKMKVGSHISTQSSPYIKRANNSNKILGDFHLQKLNQVFENF